MATTRTGAAARSQRAAGSAAAKKTTGGTTRRPAAASGTTQVMGKVAAASRSVAESDTTSLRLPCGIRLDLPPAQHLAWYLGVAVLAAAEIVDWPVALILAAGKALADNRHSAALRELGDAFEEAG